MIAVVTFFAQSATTTAWLRAPKDNFDTKRITIVIAKPIEKAPCTFILQSKIKKLDILNKITHRLLLDKII